MPTSFCFGVVADVQSCDKADGHSEGRVQRYRLAPDKLGLAVESFLALLLPRRATRSAVVNAPRCVLSLGDIIDGRDDEPTSLVDLEAVLVHFRRLPRETCPPVHVVGNHCLKFISRQRLLAELEQPESSYARHELAPGWTLLRIDSTDMSTHGGWAESTPQAKEAREFAAAHAGESRIQRYNGGIGAAQYAWLEAQLTLASAAGERVIVASHHPLLRGACRETHRAWNGDEVAMLLEAHAGTVVLALAGHDHIGGFATSRSGVHYVTLEAVLEAPEHGNAFAIIRVHDDRIVIDGCGTSVTSRVLPIAVRRSLA